jgi:hypothetical protein
MDLMSAEFKSFKLPLKGKPSTTKSGSLEALIERFPLIRMLGVAPGALLVAAMSTPATKPCKDWMAFWEGTWSKSFPLTETTAPVRSFFCWIP